MIGFQCSCGAKYQAKETSAGATLTCKKCGEPVIVPAASPAPPDPEDDTYGLERLPERSAPPKSPPAEAPLIDTGAPRSVRSSRRERAPRAESSRGRGRSLSDLLTGDIRPFLLGGFCILLGLTSIATPFLLPAFAPESLQRDPGTLVSRNERTGAGLILGMYRLFGQAGVYGLFIVAGLGFIAGGVWALKYMEFEDD